MYVSCFNILRFFAEFSTKLQKIQFFDHGNSGREHGIYTNDPIFSCTFSALPVCNVSEFENTQNSFSNSLLWSILVCKIPQCFAKSYSLRQLIILFSIVNTLRLLKIYVMFCPRAGAKYPFFRLQLIDYIGGWRKFHVEHVCLFIIFWWQRNLRSEFKHDFTNCGYLHCAILKALHCFQEKSPQAKGNAIFSSKVLNWIFKIWKIWIQATETKTSHNILILSLL